MELKPGYKQTEVGVIPEDWNVCNLEDAVEFLDGQRKPIKSSDRARIQGAYPYYGASGIVDYVNGYIFDEELILLGEDGENILSRNLPLAFRVSGKIWVNNHAHVMRPRKTFSIGYLTEFLESRDYSLLNSGTAQPKLNKQTCLKIKIAQPTKAEQTAIANVLSDTDALIQSLTRLIAKKRQIKQGTMQTLLNSYENGRLKAGWVVKKLGDIFEITAGGDLRKNEFSKTADVNHQYPIYSNALTNCGLYGYCRSFDYSGSFITVTARGNIGFSVARNCAFAAIGRLLVLKPINDINCQFVSEYINLRVEFANENTGVPQLTAPQISNYEIAIPSKNSEQTRIAAILSDMDAEIAALETKLAKYRHIKQGMMQNLLTGRIRLMKPESKTGAVA